MYERIIDNRRECKTQGVLLIAALHHKVYIDLFISHSTWKAAKRMRDCYS